MTSLPNPSGEPGLMESSVPGEDPRKGEGAGAPLREEVALDSPVPSDSAANGRGFQFLPFPASDLPIVGVCVDDNGAEDETESDDVEKVACPSCGAVNGLLDPHIDGCLKEGYVFQCDSCSVAIRVSAVDYDIHIYCRVER